MGGDFAGWGGWGDGFWGSVLLVWWERERGKVGVFT